MTARDTEPKSPEWWAEQYLHECDHLPNGNVMPLFISIIERAQSQAREQAIKEVIEACQEACFPIPGDIQSDLLEKR